MARLAFALLLLGCATAWAADDSTTRAKSHFKQGAAYYAQGLYAEALHEYESAFALVPLPDIRFNIAQARRMLGQAKAALDDYRKYLAAEPDGVAAPEARRYVAELTVMLERDRVAAEKAAAERAAAEKAAAERAAAEKAVAEQGAAEKAAARNDESRGRGKRVAGIVIGVVGIGALAAGGALIGLAAKANDDYLHPRDGIYSPEAEANRASFRTGGIVLLAVGGAAVVSGIALFVVGRREARRSSVAISLNR